MILQTRHNPSLYNLLTFMKGYNLFLQRNPFQLGHESIVYEEIGRMKDALVGMCASRRRKKETSFFLNLRFPYEEEILF